MKYLALDLPGGFHIDDPLSLGKNPVPFASGEIGPVIGTLLPYIYILAGLALGAFLIIGGFELLTSAGNPENIKKGQGKITAAVIGFIIIFASYWLIQLIETIFGINILQD